MSTDTATTSAAPSAIDWMTGRLTKASVAMDTMTVTPEATTVSPEVASAIRRARGTGSPPSSSSRKRRIMNIE
ncbi:hypothetical protein SAZ11_41235 [Streptomyces sp. FXJ1.4098]|nr:hypothetical protein [Streptomyces sp. FXJ1.4098]